MALLLELLEETDDDDELLLDVPMALT